MTLELTIQEAEKMFDKFYMDNIYRIPQETPDMLLKVFYYEGITQGLRHIIETFEKQHVI